MVMITVGDLCLHARRHGGKSPDCPLRGVADFVADAVWRVPVEVSPNVGATGKGAVEDRTGIEAEWWPEHRRRRQQDELVEPFGELERVEGCDPAPIGVPNESDVVDVEFVEDLVEPTHEVAGTAGLLPVDASPDVVDVIEGVHAMLGGERFDHR
jgi:hypothetical protein